MGIQFHQSRKKPWGVTWKNPWTGKKHVRGFDNEASAVAFDTAQADMAAKEKTLLRKTHERKGGYALSTVKEILETYFRLSRSNTLTIKQDRYHAAHILAAFGHRQAKGLGRQDILHFSEAQHVRGIAQSTVNRRVSILRAALNWSVRTEFCLKTPFMTCACPKRERGASRHPPHEKRKPFYGRQHRMCSASSFLACAPARVSAPVNFSDWSGEMWICPMP